MTAPSDNLARREPNGLVAQKAEEHEDELEALVERYRIIIEEATDGIFLLDKQGIFVDVNASGLRLLGRQREEVIGRQFRDSVFKEDLPALEKDWISIQQGAVYFGEGRLKRKDGSLVTVEVGTEKLPDGHVQGILRDISRRKEAEQALREREERFHKLTAATFEGICITETGKVMDVNDQYAQMVGYSREELVGQSVTILVAPECRQLVADTIKSGGEGPYEHRALRKDGTVFEAEVRARSVMWGGRLVRVSAIRDITERKRAERSMRRQLAFDEVLNRILRQFAICAASDADAEVVKALQAIAEFIGVDHAYVALFSAENTSWSAAYEWGAPNVPRKLHLYQELPRGTKPWSEARVLAGDTIRLNTLSDYPPEAGHEREMDEAEGALSVLSVPIRGQRGQFIGCVGLHAHARPIIWSDADGVRLKLVGDAIANLLERKRVEDSLREVSHRLHRSQDEERRRIARELHDSTAQLLAAAMMILGEMEDALAARDAKVKKLVQEGMRVVELCSQEVRTLAHLLHPPLLDQMGLVSALRSYVEGFTKRSGIKVALDLTDDLGRLPEEAELTLFRMVQEGLGNIRRHSGSRTAHILLAQTGSGVILEIEDQGSGMPAEILQAIRNGSVTQGVGLAAMQERLREIGALLEVESSSVGTRLRAVVRVGEHNHESCTHFDCG